MTSLSFKILILSSIVALPLAIQAQETEELLELPGFVSSSGDSDISVDGLKLLSADELQKLYQTQPEAEPTVPPVNITNESQPTTPENSAETEEMQVVEVPEQEEEPAEEDSYATLIEDLQSENEDPNAEQFDINALWEKPSMMLRSNEITLFNSAVTRHIKSLIPPDLPEPPPVVLSEETGEPVEPEAPPGRYLFITLDTLIYRNKDDWAAWINGTKYTPEDREVLNGLKLKSLSKNQVHIHWTKHSGDILAPESSDVNMGMVGTGDPNAMNDPVMMAGDPNMMAGEVANPEPDNAENSETVTIEEEKELPDNVYQIDDSNYIITLSPNQAFITYNFTMHEGRVVTKEIAALYQRYQAQKQQQQSSIEMEAGAGATPQDQPMVGADGEIIDSVEQEAIDSRDQENLAKLLELYKNSGLADSVANGTQ